MVLATKDPVKQRAGKAGAIARWGSDPRTVRLDSLSAEQRAVVLALIRAAENATKKDASATNADVPGKEGVRDAVARSPTSR